MVEFKNKSIGAALQKFFPLKVVPLAEIPHPSKLMDSNCLDAEDLALIANNLVVLCKNSKGVGLAAVQCGLPLKMFVASTDGINFRCFLDLEYRSDDEKQNSLESCLSIKDEKGFFRRFLVKRYNRASFAGKELVIKDNLNNMIDFKEDFVGLMSVVCQHEIDHHNGKLIMDEGKEVEVIS